MCRHIQRSCSGGSRTVRLRAIPCLRHQALQTYASATPSVGVFDRAQSTKSSATPLRASAHPFASRIPEQDANSSTQRSITCTMHAHTLSMQCVVILYRPPIVQQQRTPLPPISGCSSTDIVTEQGNAYAAAALALPALRMWATASGCVCPQRQAYPQLTRV